MTTTLQKLINQATPLPWKINAKAYHNTIGTFREDGEIKEHVCDCDRNPEWSHSRKVKPDYNALLITHCTEHLPKLVEAVERYLDEVYSFSKSRDSVEDARKALRDTLKAAQTVRLGE